MKERPILFNSEMVRAILDKKKTQTRRIIKPQPLKRETTFWRDGEYYFGVDEITKTRGKSFKCPYGKPGDRLWVRETWKYYDWTEDGEPFIQYSANGEISGALEYPENWSSRIENIWEKLSEKENYDIYGAARDNKWRSPRFMPHWASRITLEIINVRVERVQDIMPDDIIAEGVWQRKNSIDADCERSYKVFANLWDSINAKRGYSWASNPFVWVIEFRRTK
jgi:hypothetical protein